MGSGQLFRDYQLANLGCPDNWSMFQGDMPRHQLVVGCIAEDPVAERRIGME